MNEKVRIWIKEAGFWLEKINQRYFATIRSYRYSQMLKKTLEKIVDIIEEIDKKIKNE